ncbi:MAG: DNA helicase UvrBC [Spirochaetaceae bacterium]|nr:DNA helicase UvrBC [Spirochaetaceae bacterium]
MKCDICKLKEAILFVRQEYNSSVIELHLCADCAKERGLSTEGNKIEMSIGGLVTGLLHNTLEERLQRSRLVCKTCGRSLGDIKKTFRVGCPECYTVFKNEITELLKNYKNITLPFSGKLPKQILHFKSHITDRMLMQNLLEQAVEREDYEKAAYYRDQLKLLEKAEAGIETIPSKDSALNNPATKEGETNE